MMYARYSYLMLAINSIIFVYCADWTSKPLWENFYSLAECLYTLHFYLQTYRDMLHGSGEACLTMHECALTVHTELYHNNCVCVRTTVQSFRNYFVLTHTVRTLNWNFHGMFTRLLLLEWHNVIALLQDFWLFSNFVQSTMTISYIHESPLLPRQLEKWTEYVHYWYGIQTSA